MLTFAQILKNVVKHQATFMEVYLKMSLFCLTFSLVQSTFKRLMRDRPLLVETTWRLHRAGKHTRTVWFKRPDCFSCFFFPFSSSPKHTPSSFFLLHLLILRPSLISARHSSKSVPFHCPCLSCHSLCIAFINTLWHNPAFRGATDCLWAAERRKILMEDMEWACHSYSAERDSNFV